MRARGQGVPKAWAPTRGVAAGELLPPWAVRASLHGSPGAREQLASSPQVMAQLPRACSSRERAACEETSPLPGSVRTGTLIIAQHGHFKQLMSQGRNLIISDESSSRKRVGWGMVKWSVFVLRIGPVKHK